MTIQKFSPVHGELLGEYPIASKEEVEEAVARARKAAPGWAAIPLERRLKQLDKLRKIIVEEGEQIAREISKDDKNEIMYSTEKLVNHPDILKRNTEQFAQMI